MEWSCRACGARWPSSHGFCGRCGAARAATDAATSDVDDVLRALVGEQLRAELVAHGGRLPEERRLVTALFADLSGFTPLAGRLDPEDLAEVVDPLLAGLVRIVKRGEGHVGSFAGDALLAYFGAPVAHEDDPQRAVRCAAEMLEEFPSLLADAPEVAASLTLRIGVDTGAVMARLVAGDIKTDYNILGNSVNMAQRLQSNAPPGGCVVGETTWRLCQDAFEFEDLGGIRVKGRDEPLPARLLLRERRAVVRRRAATARLVSRDAELARLAELEEPAPGRGLLLLGEAGAGKSRLLEEARRRSGRSWLEGGCAAHDTTSSYRPWLGVLRGVEGDAHGLRALRGDTQVPELEALAPAARRALVARSVTDLLRGLAPCVVVLEDLHWADQASLDLLDDVLHELGDADVLVLGTSREPVATTAAFDTLELEPLAESAVGDLVGDLLDGVPPDVLVGDIARRSGGNPLYVAELSAALQQRGLVERVEGGALVAPTSGLQGALDLVPDTLEGLVGARIDALPSAWERVLTVAAVLATPVNERLVSEVAVQLAQPHAEVPQGLKELQAGGFLDGDRFVHAVVQDTVYLRVPRARRRAIHRAAAEVGPRVVPAEELPGYLARHLYLGGAGPRAVVALERAAADALERGAHEEAVLHLQRDVELRRTASAEVDQRALLPARLVALGELLELLGRYTEAEPVLREAISLGARGAVHWSLVGCLRRLGRYDEAVALADEVIGAGVDVALRDRLVEEKAWSLAAQGELDAALGALQPTADPVSRARQDLVRSYCLIEQADLVDAEALLTAAVSALRAAGEPALAARGHRLLGQVLAKRGELIPSKAVFEEGLILARASGAAEETAACLNNLVLLALPSGDPDAAVRYAREAVLQSDRMRHTFGRAVTRNNLSIALTGAGRAVEGVEVATEAIEMARSSGLSGMEGAFLHTRGSAKLALADMAGARTDAKASLELVLGTEDEPDARELLEQVAESEIAGPPAPP